MAKPLNTIFIGTSKFGTASLKSLFKDGFFNLRLVVTQPDRKIGRRQILNPSPIKSLASDLGIRVEQPEKISDFSVPISDLDLIVVIAYAQIIPDQILNLPKYGCVNVHGSLLPAYRGASCLQWPIANGDKETGITLIRMDQGLDTGPIIAQRTLAIDQNDTADSISEKLSALSGETIVKDLKKYINGDFAIRPQDESRASYVKALKKEDGHINWQKNAQEIERFVRAMYSWPGAFSRINPNKILKILEADGSFEADSKHEAGEIFFKNNKIFIKAKDQALRIKKLQISGKKPMSEQEFVNGYQNLEGRILS